MIVCFNKTAIIITIRRVFTVFFDKKSFINNETIEYPDIAKLFSYPDYFKGELKSYESVLFT